ncbi:MAG TPA: DUF2800 domain-containing protein [Methylomirabilota bacterium]|nr:DUF2800 domain-containing protein [Methylomirabilota bacterium]
MMRPSSLPALAQCPCFESGPSSDDAKAGTARHAALSAYLAGNDGPASQLPEEDQEGIEWAAEYIRIHADIASHPLRCEQPMTLLLDDWSEIKGTPDIVCGTEIFDLKWRERDYLAQMAAYAWMRIQELPPGAGIKVHILFAQNRKAHVQTFDEHICRAIIQPIIDAARADDRKPNPCAYCDWCAHKVACPALQDRALAVAKGREDWQLEQYHTSQITEPTEMAKALVLAKLVKKWAEAVEHFAAEMVVKQGKQIPGWRLQEKAGRRQCIDLQGAYTATGMPLDQFLPCCQITFGDLEEAYAKYHKVTKSAAAKEIKTKLAPFVEQGNPSQFLVPEKE